MDVEEIKKLKDQSEDEILKILQAFKEKTGCSVHDIDLASAREVGDKNLNIVGVVLRVQI